MSDLSSNNKKDEGIKYAQKMIEAYKQVKPLSNENLYNRIFEGIPRWVKAEDPDTRQKYASHLAKLKATQWKPGFIVAAHFLLDHLYMETQKEITYQALVAEAIGRLNDPESFMRHTPQDESSPAQL